MTLSDKIEDYNGESEPDINVKDVKEFIAKMLKLVKYADVDFRDQFKFEVKKLAGEKLI